MHMQGRYGTHRAGLLPCLSWIDAQLITYSCQAILNALQVASHLHSRCFCFACTRIGCCLQGGLHDAYTADMMDTQIAVVGSSVALGMLGDDETQMVYKC